MSIEAFEKHVLVRQLYIAKTLAQHFEENAPNDPLAESAFAILHLCWQYFEMIDKIETGYVGKNQPGPRFKSGLGRVFPGLTEDQCGNVYALMRCGMFHMGIPNTPLELNRGFTFPLRIEGGIFKCNPARLIDVLIDHFRTFCTRLKDGENCGLQENFRRVWGNILADVDSTQACVPYATDETTRNPAE